MKIEIFRAIWTICFLSCFSAFAQTMLIEKKLKEEIRRSVEFDVKYVNKTNIRMSAPPSPPSRVIVAAGIPEPPAAPLPVADQAIILQEGKFDTEKSKILIKNYSVNADDKLVINNQYGNIRVNTWYKNEIKVEILIKAFESNEGKAQDILDGVSVSELKQGNTVSLKTNINRARSGGGWWGTKKSNGNVERRGVQINYTISMPSKIALDITNEHGSVFLPSLTGVVTVNASYGSFSAEKLSNASNRIKVAYGSASIESLRAGSLQISYGGLSLGSADILDANVSYSSAKIGKLSGTGDVSLKYCGRFKIDEIDRGVKKLNVEAEYSSVSLGFDEAASFNFDVTVSYNNFKYTSDKMGVTSTSPDEKSKGFQPTKNYKGMIGKGSDAKVTVNSRYGPVQFL